MCFRQNLWRRSKHILCSVTFSFQKSCPLCDNVGKFGTAGQAIGDNIIRRLRFACEVNKTTDTHLEYVMIIAFPGEQCLRESASMLGYK